MITLTHKDGSADFHPSIGEFPRLYDLHDYQGRNGQYTQRSKEIVSLINEVSKP